MEAIVNNRAGSGGELAAEAQRINTTFFVLDKLFGLARSSGVREFSASGEEMQAIFSAVRDRHPKLLSTVRIYRTTEFTVNLSSSSDLEEYMVSGIKRPIERIGENRYAICDTSEELAHVWAPVFIGKIKAEYPYVQEPVFVPRAEDYESAAEDLTKELKRRQ